MKLIIGLGNPGKNYEATRHNFGHVLISSYANDNNLKLTKHKSNALVATTKINDEQIILATPSSYMNESGFPVKELASFYKVAPKDIIICYDDIDLPFETIRISKNTSSGGHNGIKSIIEHLSSTEFVRIRLGIGPKLGPAEKYVLQCWPSEQKDLLEKVICRACSAIDMLIRDGLEKTANQFN